MGNGPQQGGIGQQQLVRNSGGTQNTQGVLPPQLFNLSVNHAGPSHQLQFQSGASYSDSTSQLQLNAAAAAAAANSLQLPPGNFQNLTSMNLLTDQLSVGQLISQTSTHSQPLSLQGLITPVSVAVGGVTFSQQVHTTSNDQSQQPKQRVFTGTVT